jgi:putative FmdB family regulatory protein
MPTYEYRCPDGHDFERFFRKISDAPKEVACPECGKIAERKLSAGAGLLFKGSGFYLTDYGKNAHRGTAPESASSGESKGGEPKGGESKSGESKGGETKSESPKAADSAPAATKSEKPTSGSSAPADKSTKSDK